MAPLRYPQVEIEPRQAEKTSNVAYRPTCVWSIREDRNVKRPTRASAIGRSFQDREDDLGPVRRLVWARLFGQCVGKTREAAGRSVEEAARLAGMETSQWAAVEAGYELLSSTNIPSEQEISFMRETIHRQSQEI